MQFRGAEGPFLPLSENKVPDFSGAILFAMQRLFPMNRIQWWVNPMLGKSGLFGRKICLPHSDSRRLCLAAGFRSEGNNMAAITDGKDRAAEHVRTYLKRVANLELPPLNWKKSPSR
jgi:hypothetical protein